MYRRTGEYVVLFLYYDQNFICRAVDPDPYGSTFILPPGGKFFQIKTEKGKEIANNCNFIQFLK